MKDLLRVIIIIGLTAGFLYFLDYLETQRCINQCMTDTECEVCNE
jgi:hypothetical protein